MSRRSHQMEPSAPRRGLYRLLTVGVLTRPHADTLAVMRLRFPVLPSSPFTLQPMPAFLSLPRLAPATVLATARPNIFPLPSAFLAQANIFGLGRPPLPVRPFWCQAGLTPSLLHEQRKAAMGAASTQRKETVQ